MLRFGHPKPSFRALRCMGVTVALLAMLAGCGFVRYEQREPWRAEAEQACMRSGIVRQTNYIRSTKPVEGPGSCGFDLPLKVAAFEIDPQTQSSYASTSAPNLGQFRLGPERDLTLTTLKPEVTMGCPMVAWTDDWVNGSVQPAALAWLGQGVVEVRTAGSYSCRRRNHNPGARLSEHAFGNAIDIMSFALADGTVITVKNGWRGGEREQGFLRDVLHGACERFKTVLGPGADALHHDHFHFDLARHDARGQRRYCKPQIAKPQRPLPGGFDPMIARNPTLPSDMARLQAPRTPGLLGQMPSTLGARPQGSTLEQQATEIEGEFNPTDFDITSSTLDLPRPRRPIEQPLPNTSSSIFSRLPGVPSPAPTSRNQNMREIPLNGR